MDIKRIDWSKLTCLTGFSSHVPDAIKKLDAPEEETRYNAYWLIDNFVVCQSSLYEASYYVIEPVVELLEKEYTVDRTHPLCLLAEIALGGGSEVITLQDTGERKTIRHACSHKFIELKPRIEAIVVKTPREEKEKQDILDAYNEIGSYPGMLFHKGLSGVSSPPPFVSFKVLPFFRRFLKRML